MNVAHKRLHEKNAMLRPLTTDIRKMTKGLEIPKSRNLSPYLFLLRLILKVKAYAAILIVLCYYFFVIIVVIL